jgi:hypothetical protein
MTKGAYDLQMLRIQAGLRLCANFRAKLGLTSDPTEEDDEDAVKIIDQLKESYGKLTEGVARNRTLPRKEGFEGDELISTFTELQLVDQYMALVKQEKAQFRQLETSLEMIPIYNSYLSEMPGVGPAMAAVLISYFDPHAAPYPSSFWAYAGLDVAKDGRGRSRREEHLIDREYTAKDGSTKTKRSVTYNPWLKARLMGALGASFMRVKDCPWREVYDGYKNRLQTDPAKLKVTSEQYKALHKSKPEEARNVWTPRRIHLASVRYMLKMFLAEFWEMWRRSEGLSTPETYAVGKLGMPPHRRREAAE